MPPSDTASLADLTRRLEALEIQLAVTGAYFHYAWLLDSRDWNRVAEEIFAPDGELSLGTGLPTHRGRAAIARAFDEMLPTLDGTAHYFTNIVVTPGPGGNATGRAYFQSWHWTQESTGAGPRRPVDFIGAGVYLDTWRRTEEGWRVVRRRRRNLGPGPLGMGTTPASFDAAMPGWGGAREE